MTGNSVFFANRFNDRTLIESVLQSFFIIDYGYIKNVNIDKTIDVVHAKRLKTYTDENLPQTETKEIEVLTLSGSGFSIQFDYKKGDKVLLLGLKDYIPKVDDVTSATATTTYLHYTRETIKALPLCIFNDEAKVTVQIENGDMAVDTQGKIKLNGDSKQLVTWAELNNALSTFLTQLTIAMTTTPIAGNGALQPAWTNMPTSIDISAAKTTKVVTGG